MKTDLLISVDWKHKCEIYLHIEKTCLLILAVTLMSVNSCQMVGDASFDDPMMRRMDHQTRKQEGNGQE